jgi:hypothetical protein
MIKEPRRFDRRGSFARRRQTATAPHDLTIASLVDTDENAPEHHRAEQDEKQGLNTVAQGVARIASCLPRTAPLFCPHSDH